MLRAAPFTMSRLGPLPPRDRPAGSSYGTLPGHPEACEHRLALEQHSDGTISIAIRAFSRPVSRSARLGRPFTRRVQQMMTARYRRALDRP
jgi:uncharacterized protein (UPF0548 family)